MDKINDQQQWEIVGFGKRNSSPTVEQLVTDAKAYFKWCDENPIKSKQTLKSGKTQGSKIDIEYKRPYSIKGLCLHCGISERYINDIRETYQPDSEYYLAMEQILMVIYTNNLEGAIVDLYNPIMVSKVLNMEAPQENNNNRIVVEVINSNDKLENSESEVLKKLSSEKLIQLGEKVENFNS